MDTRDSYIFFDQDTAFQGEVNTDHLVLEGIITGDVLASKDVFLKQGALVQGEIATKKYTIEEGSIHQGKLRMDMNNKESKGNITDTVKASKNIPGSNGTAGENSPSGIKGFRTNGTNGSSTNNESKGKNGTPHSPERYKQESSNTNGHFVNDEDDDEQQSVFELINMKESISEQEANDHQEKDERYTEPPPSERLW